ncbi:LOG family protein [Arachidicoccus soli]|uniref:Cytokinin riboside 5'-monophosphate phosphoribohydrolase n=1 Tax=Arachidicoccus soli TaxID=2341117 RepID=A0A386HR05_9BACT|nr:TIGR00730 family Rossman fold protein [Arachidicoccus soli]AYD48388.1 TIGR00730 family Rossman fold protein [Arachidicoccus soli]
MKGKKIRAKKMLYLDSPKSGIWEFGFALRVAWQFMYNARLLHNIGPGITVFGSARLKEEDAYYQAAREFGKRIAAMSFTTITGGGPGIMEAANRGAFEAGGISVGMNILLPHEQHENPYLTTSIVFEHFFTRKVMLVKHSFAFIIMPGGFGTMDEGFEIITLIQTRMVDRYPVVLFGSVFYKSIFEEMQVMAKNGTISPADMDLIFVTDSVDDAMKYIQTFIHKTYNIVKHRPRWRWLEKK